jgi:imidazole glycerol-phosphate synthase subunit HisH
MSRKVVIIDYQLGNLFSVKQACEYLGYEASISSNPADLKEASFAILPGVGAFADGMENLRAFGLDQGIRDYVDAGKPLMGVCLGLQLLLTESDEFGNTQGLNLIPGVVRKFRKVELDGHAYKVPQIQWNLIREPETGRWTNSPLQVCASGDFMYFVHSFYAEPSDARYVLARTEYGETDYCSAVLKDNVFATQFHPEKSGLYGVNIYKEWFNLYSK